MRDGPCGQKTRLSSGKNSSEFWQEFNSTAAFWWSRWIAWAVEGGDDCRKNCRNREQQEQDSSSSSSSSSSLPAAALWEPLLALPRVLLQQRPGPVGPWAFIHPLRVCFCSLHPVGIIVIITMSKILAKEFSNQVASYCLIIMAIPIMATEL